MADRLNLLYLDTGAMYRALANVALHTGTDVDNEPAIARLLETHRIEVGLDRTAPLGFRISVDGVELAERTLQSSEVTAIVSTIAAHPRVREAMVHEQRRIAAAGDVVMAGRDIGTVVLPGAPVKIFLTASVRSRVARRRTQLAAAGVDVDEHRLFEEIEERDRLDRSRAVSPLVTAPDAHIVDSSDQSVDQTVDELVTIVERQRAGGV